MNQDKIDAFWAEVASLTKPFEPVKIEYRLYYNELGEITLGTADSSDHLGTYIVVSKEEYETYFNYRIVKGKLIKIEHDAGYCVKLKKSTKGFHVVKNNAGLILEAGEAHNDTEYYETNN